MDFKRPLVRPIGPVLDPRATRVVSARLPGECRETCDLCRSRWDLFVAIGPITRPVMMRSKGDLALPYLLYQTESKSTTGENPGKAFHPPPLKWRGFHGLKPDICSLTLPPLKGVGFSVRRQPPGVPGLTLSPRAFRGRSLPFPRAPRYGSGQPVSQLSEQRPGRGAWFSRPLRPCPFNVLPGRGPDRIRREISGRNRRRRVFKERSLAGQVHYPAKPTCLQGC